MYIVLKHSSHLLCIESFNLNMFFFVGHLELLSSIFGSVSCFSLDGIWQAHETAREGQDRHPKAALVNKKSRN